jgi:hypothetical protein
MKLKLHRLAYPSLALHTPVLTLPPRLMTLHNILLTTIPSTSINPGFNMR